MGISSVSLSSENNSQLNTALKKAGIKKELFQFSEQLSSTLSDQIAEMIDPKYKGNFSHKLLNFPFIVCYNLRRNSQQLNYCWDGCREMNSAFQDFCYPTNLEQIEASF